MLATSHCALGKLILKSSAPKKFPSNSKSVPSSLKQGSQWSLGVAYKRSFFKVTTSLILDLQASAMAHLVDNYWETCFKICSDFSITSYWFFKMIFWASIFRAIIAHFHRFSIFKNLVVINFFHFKQINTGKENLKV